jgi:hypothetical protein
MLLNEVKFILTMKKGNDCLRVEYHPYRWEHDVFDKDGFVGACKMKEFLKEGWECVNREIVI